MINKYIINIPKKIYKHYETLINIKSPDFNYDHEIILNTFNVDIDAPTYLVTLFVYNMQQLICIEYQLIDLMKNEEIRSSPILFNLRDEWDFKFQGKEYNISIVESK